MSPVANSLVSVADARVLAVDDSRANTMLLERLLVRAGLTHVEQVNDPAAVMGLIDNGEVDLVLLDLRMPGIDGFELLRQIQQRAAGTFLPVIIVSSDDSRASVERALEIGAHDFLVKPVDPHELVLRVRNLLLHRRAYQELRRSRAWLRTRLDLFEPGLGPATTDPEMVRAMLRDVLDHGRLRMAVQPVVNLRDGSLQGYEALARFPDGLGPPNTWFAAALATGLGLELELAAAAAAVEVLRVVPDEVPLAINVSPSAVLADLQVCLGPDVPWHRVVLELTEHVPVEDYVALNRALQPLQAMGARLAVDDTGAGFASLRHILNLHPDFIKLDLAIVRGVDRDPSRAAMAEMLLSFGERVGVQVVAEGIETVEERDTLLSLGAVLGQGYLLGRPRIIE